MIDVLFLKLLHYRNNKSYENTTVIKANTDDFNKE